MAQGRRFHGLVLLCALALTVVGGMVLVTSTPVEAKRCCWVVVCSTQPPIVCWEECRTCPRFP